MRSERIAIISFIYGKSSCSELRSKPTTPRRIVEATAGHRRRRGSHARTALASGDFPFPRQSCARSPPQILLLRAFSSEVPIHLQINPQIPIQSLNPSSGDGHHEKGGGSLPPPWLKSCSRRRHESEEQLRRKRGRELRWRRSRFGRPW